MATKLRTAMVFAAGLGKRMQPLTSQRPKPLIEVGGRSMLERALDALGRAGIERAVVNSHHLADQVHAAVEARRGRGEGPEVLISHEPTLLETGGGVVKALNLLGDEPFVSVNGDVVWLDGACSAVRRLAEAFEPSRMDAMLLLHPREQAVGYAGEGDFALEPQDGQLTRSPSGPRPFVFTGVQVWHPRAFEGREPEPFSLSEIYRMRRDPGGRLDRMFGLVHDGQWLHVGTPADLEAAERALSVHEQHTPPQP